MRLIFDRNMLASTGWTLVDGVLGTMASHDDREGKVTMLLRAAEDERLEFTIPAPETFDEGLFLTHLLDVLHENITKYTIA